MLRSGSAQQAHLVRHCRDDGARSIGVLPILSLLPRVPLGEHLVPVNFDNREAFAPRERCVGGLDERIGAQLLQRLARRCRGTVQ